MRRLTLLSATLLLIPALLAAQGKIELPLSLGELEKRVRADSNDAAAHYNVALAYWNAKRWDDVERELKLAVALEPRFAAARLALSRVPFARRPKLIEEVTLVGLAPPKELLPALEQSDRDFRHAFLIDPMVDLKIIAAAIPQSVSMWDVRDAMGDAMALYYQASIDCFEGRYADCQGKYTRLFNELRTSGAVGRLPDNVYWLRGLAAAHQKDFAVAVQDFKYLMDREKDRAKKVEERDVLRVPMRTNEYRYFTATFLHAAGNTADAIALYKEALENDLGLYMAHVRLAQIYESQRNYESAIEERRRAVAANPDDPTLLLDLGVTLGKSGDFATAEAELVRATDASPRNAEAWFWLGLAREQLGRRADARAAYEKVVALAPSRLAARVTTARQKVAALQ